MQNQILTKELRQLEKFIEQYEITNTVISEVSIGWHIDHSFRVISAVCRSILKSTASEYKYARNKNRSKIKLLGYIPRGLGKAPKGVITENTIEKHHLNIHLEQAKSLLEKLQLLEQNSHFEHPIFGVLNKRNTIWFLKLHTVHHLKIIKDIAESNLD